MERVAKLKASRKAFHSHLTRIYGKIEELNLTKKDEETTTLTLSYIDQLQRKAESIDGLDLKIAAGVEHPKDLEREIFEAEEIKDTLIEKTTCLKRYLELHKTSNEPTPPRNVAPSTSASRLPKLNLPMFSGDPIKWQSFWDSFEAAVHTSRCRKVQLPESTTGG